VSQKSKTEAEELAEFEELKKLVARAEKGDASALPELRKRLAADASLWDVFGNLGRHAEAGLIALAAGDNLHFRECLIRRLAKMKQDLESPNASALERLLIERITTTWIQLALFDNLQAQNRSLTPAQAMQLQRQQESAQRRHLQAIRSLGTMRKLLPPAKPVKKTAAPVLPDSPRFSSACDADSLTQGVGVFN
jgi:hypothetical protein